MIKRFTNKIILTLLCAMISVIALQAQEYVYVYKKGQIVFEELSSVVDSIALEEAKSKIALYSNDGNLLYSASIADVDSIAFEVAKPTADIFDISFKADGHAEDISLMKNPVITGGTTASTYYNNTYKRFVGKFVNPWAGTATGYYKMDYQYNQTIRDMLADGHTMEAVFMADYEGQIADGEAKFFAAHQKGGTGFLISKISGARKNEITFLPNVSTTGSSSWKWGNTGVVPEAKVYYHVVGVWNKEEGKVYVYVNGELKSEIDAVGELVFTDPDTCNWFCVGADPSASGAHCSWTGDVVIARAYDAPLNSKQVDVLWNEIKTLQEDASVDMVSNIDYYSGIAATIGSYYSISGEGFKNGDKIGFNSITDDKNSVVLNCILNDTKGVKVQIPSGFKTDQYRMMLMRDGDMQDLGLTIINVVDVFPTAPQIIAHRGYWDTDGASQNSLAAIHKAFDLNVYGSELDVWLTTDGYLMMNHDSSYGGITIQNSTYDQVKDLTLSNGEKMPQLKDALAILKSNTGASKLIIEIKTHNTYAKNMAVSRAVIDAVAAEGLKDKVEYIAFSLDVCKELVRIDPNATVVYLNGDLAPSTLKTYGIAGIDYKMSKLRDNMQWITDAKNNDMIVNVWTVNSVAEMIEWTNAGADFITTDKPNEALAIRQYYLDNQNK